MGAGYHTSNFKKHSAVCRQRESKQKRASTSQRDLKLMSLQCSWLGDHRGHPGSLESQPRNIRYTDRKSVPGN